MLKKRWKDPTKGTWFAAYGCVYSQLGDGTVVRVALMDRDETDTLPTERDANVHYIVKLQNENVRREITAENYDLALKQIGE
jgi:hypothetical protein